MVKSLPMKSLLQRRKVVLLFSVIAVLMLVWLAAGLSDLSLAPGYSMQIWGNESNSVAQTSFDFIKEDIAETPIWQQVVLSILFVVIFGVFMALLPADVRKRIIKSMLSIALIIFIMLYYFDNYKMLTSPLPLEFSTEMGAAEAIEEFSVSSPVYESKPISPALVYFISTVVVLVFALIAWRLLKPWLYLRNKKPLDNFGNIARASLDDLSEGQEWEDVIINAYMQMSEIARDRRGVLRQQAMTPSEFMSRLEFAGLPPDPIRRLTRLFEKVRYSGKRAAENEIDEARACLKAIAAACGEPL
ncbi:MAG: DUF4129 domain-containing protein [Anaerolineae bacterium]|jgi:hypothetical protein|nr:DUF4129 domain-containing protein [Anaerolineae bacterium]